jgi:hypothetical protein
MGKLSCETLLYLTWLSQLRHKFHANLYAGLFILLVQIRPSSVFFSWSNVRSFCFTGNRKGNFLDRSGRRSTTFLPSPPRQGGHICRFISLWTLLTYWPPYPMHRAQYGWIPIWLSWRRQRARKQQSPTAFKRKRRKRRKKMKNTTYEWLGSLRTLRPPHPAVHWTSASELPDR